ncbi:MAG: GAF domain-containing protein [Alphaproteobacteria bacterium]|nr:GAF domain-containing protein [Alphaproteobacteria bacterium]
MGMHGSDDEDIGRLRRVNELFAALLDLEAIEDPAKLLKTALQVAVDQLEARAGFLGVFESSAAAGKPPRWHTSILPPRGRQGGEDAPFSLSIIQDTLQKQTVQRIISALGDQRFMYRQSVRDFEITSVLCAPVGSDGVAVMYLQDRRTGFFQERDEEYFARLARLISPYVDRVVFRDRLAEPRPEPAPAPNELRVTVDPEDPSARHGVPWLLPIPEEGLPQWKDAKDLFARHFLWWAWKHHGNKTAAAEAVGPARGQFFHQWTRLGLNEWLAEERAAGRLASDDDA